MNLAKLVSLGIALLLIQACSHPIEIVGEGDVTSQSGNRNCSLEQFKAANPACSKNYAGIDLEQLPALVAEDYAETYNPAPRPGWMFSHWVNYCTTATPPTYDCVFDFPAATVQQFWGKTMPALKAVFCLIDDPDCDGLIGDEDPCPANPSNPCALITGNDIVTRDGKEWAQPDLFTLKPDLDPAITWNRMNAACPKGKCKVGAVLNGKDLTGWTWAGFRDVARLYNSFGASLSTDVPDGQNVANSTWAPAVYAAGFRPTLYDSTFRTIYFMLPVDVAGGISEGAYAGSQDYVDPESYDYAGTNTGINLTYGEYSGCGFLLYRTIP